MSDNTENKGKLEQFHLRGRNYDSVVRQLVEKYNASEGWAVVRVVPSILSLDVYLERNAEQGDKKGAKSAEATVSKTPVKNNLAEDVSDEKENKEVIEKPTVKKTAAKQTTKK